jgi:DNA primase
MIPDEVITQIRDAADIVAVIGQHVQLRKAGRNWKGLCPFHGEKTPSFNVSPDKGFFHCFGCQKHGDVFTFVMELEGKSFVEAAEQLAGRFGIVVPRIEESPELRRARGERVAMLDLNKLAAAFYREVLADPKRGEPGRAYLARRGVSTETAERFQLGYAPADWGALADHLKATRCDLELAVKLGLVAHRPRAGGYYDRNRDRLVASRRASWGRWSSGRQGKTRERTPTASRRSTSTAPRARSTRRASSCSGWRRRATRWPRGSAPCSSRATSMSSRSTRPGSRRWWRRSGRR